MNFGDTPYDHLDKAEKRVKKLEADNARLLAENQKLKAVAEAVVKLRKANERWASSLAFGDDLSYEADAALAALNAVLAAAGYLSSPPADKDQA